MRSARRRTCSWVEGSGPRIILGGLCAGGFWSFQGADRDERVTAALLLNPGALVWHDDLVRARDAARLRRLLRPAWWSRLLRGKVRRARIRSIASAAVRTPGRRDPGIHESSAILSRLAARDVALEIAFSGDEPLEQELTRGGLFADGSRWPGLTRHRLPGRDHTLRPVVAQRGASAILDAGMRRELTRGREGDARPDDAPTASDTNEQPTMTTQTGWTIPQPGPVVDDPTRIPAGVSGP